MQVKYTIEALTLEQLEELIAHYHKRWPSTGYGTSTGTISYRPVSYTHLRAHET
jgi:hypothetical protein